MKKNILVLAASVMGTAMLLSSCQERLGSEGNIGFTANVASYKGYNVGSKAAPIGDPLNDPDTYVPLFQTTYGSNGFSVSAYKGTTLKFDGTSKYVSGDWALDQTATWISGENLDFYAIAPIAARGISGYNVDPATKQMTFTYQVPSNKGMNQPDIMVGYYSGPGEEDPNSDERRIAPLTFYHPLAAVRFIAGDVDGASVRAVAITGLYDKGTATIDMSNWKEDDPTVTTTWALDPTATPTAVSGFPFETSVTAVQDQYIGGPESAIMVIPQVLSAGAYLGFETDNPNADDDPTTPDDVLSYKVSLAGVELKAGTILNIKIDYKGVIINFDEQPLGMILPWEDLPINNIDDFTLIETNAFLSSGSVFNTTLATLAGGAENITKIVFDRGGAVDESGVHIEDPDKGGYPIYASYDRGVITITTHANTITANESCKGMFKDFNNMTDILFGLFFNTENTTDMSEMFMGCTQVKSINLIDIVNTSNVTDMSYMFSGCENATRILLGNEFYTINVTDMTHMFHNCKELKAIDLGQYFDTRNVTDMSYMFNECQTLNFMDVGESFWTCSVKKFDYMFYNITVQHLHFNSRFYINPSLNPTGENMVYNAGYYAWYITPAAFSWIKDPANNTGYNPPSANWNGGQGTTNLTPRNFPPAD